MVIKVENLGKRYIISHQSQVRHNTLRDVLAESVRQLGKRIFQPSLSNRKPDKTHEEFWALKDISFEIKQGKRIGIVGKNGAGKSTLLKILSRITEPTCGKVRIKGRVASLLEVGTGFHTELTGRENIYLNGAILGMTKAEIKKKFDEIVAFSEIEKFLDTPVKRYSSGMYVRLAFAVAAHLEPEILIVDEVLAVGDAKFQKKCLGRMEEVGKEGRTVLFVSHNMATMQQLCESAILLQNGRLIMEGMPGEVIENYLSGLVTQNDLSEQFFPLSENKKASITSIRLLNPARPSSTKVEMAAPFSIEVGIRCKSPFQPVILIQITSVNTGQKAFAAYTQESVAEIPDINHKSKVICHVDSNPLVPGRYHVNVIIGQLGERFDRQSEALSFEVIPSDVYGTGRTIYSEHNGICWTPHRWEFLEN